MWLVYLMALYFLVLSFSDDDYNLCAIIVFISCTINILIVDALHITQYFSFAQETELLLMSDGITATALAHTLSKCKLSLRMSLLLAFAVLCNFMVLWDLKITSSFVSLLFYSWYDELILMIGFLQMAIASDGLNTAFKRIREHLLCISFYFWCYNKSSHSFKKRKASP